MSVVAPPSAECADCELPFAPGDRYWLTEDDACRCDCCHEDRMAEDPFDREDHGHPHEVPS